MKQEPRPKRSSKRMKISLVLILAVLVFVGARIMHNASVKQATEKTIAVSTTKPETTTSTPSTKTTAPPTTECTTNTLAKNIVVSISKRHMWACANSSVAYNSAVVTGMENLPADLTPTGTYHIYGKQTDLYLNGSDSTGSWHDYVHTWMPFLHNKYGSYGFHDATWRKPNDFGNISPYSSDASHGCVELPLTTANWLYSWAAIGTTVTIIS